MKAFAYVAAAACAALVSLSLTVAPARAATVELLPNGEDNLQEWLYFGSPANWGGLADDDDSSGIESDGNYQQHFVAMQDATRPESVGAVTVRVRAYDDGTGTPDNIRLCVYTGTGPSESPVDIPLTDTVTEYSYTWYIDPYFWSPWTWSQVNALRAGVLRTSALSDSPHVTEIRVDVHYGTGINRWIGGSGQDWATGANWSLGRPPYADETAVVFQVESIFAPHVNVDTTCGKLVVIGYAGVTIEAGATLDVAGDVSLQGYGSGPPQLDMAATGSVLRCGGAFDVEDPYNFYAGAGTVFLLDAAADHVISDLYWNNLVVDIGGRTLELTDGFGSGVNGELTIASGTVLVPSGEQLTAYGPVTVQSGGTLELAGTATLMLGAGLTVEAGAPNGRFVASGSTPTVAPIIADAGGYAFTVNGEIDVTSLNFDGPNADGLTINDGAVVTMLDNVTFTGGTSNGGRFLRILDTSETVYSFHNHVFDGATVTTLYNVGVADIIGPGPTVNMIAATGASAGSGFEDDPNASPDDRINWYDATTDLTVLSLSPSDANPVLGDAITVTVVLGNLGPDLEGSFEVGFFYNRSSPPSPGEVPDRIETAGPIGGASTVDVVFANVTAGAGHQWEMYAVADWNGTILEPDELNNVGGPEPVTWQGPDLVVATIVPSQSDPVAGFDTITIDVTVRNLGDEPAVACDVALFYHSDTAPVVGDPLPPIGGETLSVPGLAVGAEITLTSNPISHPTAEVWSVWAIVDNAAGLDETGETNNVGGPATVAWQPVPDLVVSRVELRDAITLSLLSPPYEPDVDDIVKVEAVIANVGQATATAFDVALFYDLGAAPVALDPADREDGIASLAPGEVAPVSFNITSGAAEVWQMYFLADLGDDIDESNEANNSNPDGPIEVNWGGTTGLEVLEPNGGETWEAGTWRQIRWNTYGGAIGQPLRIEYSIDGGNSWTDIEASFTELDDGVYNWEVANENATNCVVRVTSEASGFPADVSDDPFKIIPAGQLKPDLTILSVTPSSLTPSADDTVTVEVVVQNDGYALASPFYVHLFFDRTAPPDTKDLGDRPMLVDGLTNVAAGQGNEKTLLFTNIRSDSAGVWSMYAVVDPQDYVHELDESHADNTSGPEVITWRRFWLLSPAPGAVLVQGSLCTVTWTSTLLLSDLVNIELSTDGGATWATVAWGVPNDGSHGWYVSGVPSTNCRLRISSGPISAEMDSAFTISEPMGIFGEGCAAGRSTHAAASAALLLAAVVLRLLARRPRAARS